MSDTDAVEQNTQKNKKIEERRHTSNENPSSKLHFKLSVEREFSNSNVPVLRLGLFLNYNKLRTFKVTMTETSNHRQSDNDGLLK